MFLDNTNTLLYLYGGWGYAQAGAMGNLDQLSVYNISSKEWTWILGTSTTDAMPVYGTKGISNDIVTPGGRSLHAMAFDASTATFYVHGGYVLLAASTYGESQNWLI